MTYYCRGCCKFVAGPRCTCQSCGFVHTADRPAGEDPVPFRRERRGKRDGWEHLLGKR